MVRLVLIQLQNVLVFGSLNPDWFELFLFSHIVGLPVEICFLSPRGSETVVNPIAILKNHSEFSSDLNRNWFKLFLYIQLVNLWTLFLEPAWQ